METTATNNGLANAQSNTDGLRQRLEHNNNNNKWPATKPDPFGKNRSLAATGIARLLRGGTAKNWDALSTIKARVALLLVCSFG